MSTKLIALLAGTGYGLLFVLAGIIVYLVQNGKQKHMTARTQGRVSGYSYLGNGNIAPEFTYEVGGKSYKVRRKFRSIVEKSKTAPVPTIRDSGAYLTDKDTLVIHTGNITNYESMMQAIWPIGQAAEIFYNPDKPKKARAEKMLKLPSVITTVFFWVGVGIILLGILLSIVLPEG